MARTKKTAGGRKQKHATTGVAKNKVSPAVKFTDMRANAGQKLSIAGAKMSEKMTHFRANVMLKLYRLQHPTHPVKRVAAKESILNMKAAATGQFATPSMLLDPVCVLVPFQVVSFLLNMSLRRASWFQVSRHDLIDLSLGLLMALHLLFRTCQGCRLLICERFV